MLIWDFRGATTVGPFPLAVEGAADLAFGQDGRLRTYTGTALRVWTHNPEALRQLACAARGAT